MQCVLDVGVGHQVDADPLILIGKTVVVVTLAPAEVIRRDADSRVFGLSVCITQH